MDFVLSNWNCFSLSENETFHVLLANHRGMSEFVLVAKFLTKCVLNVEAIGWTFKPFWKSWREFKVQDVGNHIVLFAFNSKTDAQRVLINGPWKFDKNLVLFSQLKNNSAI